MSFSVLNIQSFIFSVLLNLTHVSLLVFIKSDYAMVSIESTVVWWLLVLWLQVIPASDGHGGTVNCCSSSHHACMSCELNNAPS